MGSKFENEIFKLEFTGTKYNGRKNFLSQGFEKFYNWTSFANIILKSLDNFQNIESFESSVQESLRSWFMTYEGWGLLVTFLPKSLQRMYMKKLKMTKETWSQNFKEECTNEKCWKLVMEGRLKDLIPDCQVKIMHIPLGGRSREKH